MQQDLFITDLGIMPYKTAWEYQEAVLQENVQAKMQGRLDNLIPMDVRTRHSLFWVEHPPVLTIGKSGNLDNLLLSEDGLRKNGIEFYKTNRGGDITYHGPGQIVGYPIIDLEKVETDIGKYLRNMEEVIIRMLAEYGIEGGRSKGETGVWLDAGHPGRERKICAIGVRCSRWITMHGFALNVNTNLNHFQFIIPCGIVGKQVTSMEKELDEKIDLQEVKEKLKRHFLEVYGFQEATS